MGAEDFAFVSSEVPSCIYFVAMNKDSHWHNSKMKINLDKHFDASLKSMIATVYHLLEENK
jgi:metal-dependent amidase/aminoacylase/carboxypeptidase family protein